MTDIEKQGYIKKRDLLIWIMEGLVWYWDIAPGMLVLVKSQFVTPELLDSLTQILSDAMKNIKDEEALKKMGDSIDFLKRMKEAELQERNESIKLAELEIMELQLS